MAVPSWIESLKASQGSDESESELLEKMVHLLAKLSEEVGSSLEVQKTCNQALKAMVPMIADWSALFIVSEQGLQYRDCFHHNSESMLKLNQYFKTMGEQFCRSFSMSRTVLLNEAHECSLSSEGPLYRLPSSQLLCLPLSNQNEVIAVLCLGVESPRLFKTSDRILSQEAAQRFAVALSNAQRFESIQQREAQLLEAKVRAEEMSTQKTSFLAAMSHEIRSPLTAILGFSELLLAEDVDKSQQLEWSERIHKNGNHILRLTDEILNISKIESGKLELENQKISFSRLLKDLAFYEESRAAKKQISFHYKFESPVPENFYVDPTRLYQILNNLIGNAIKFTDQGGVEVTLRFKEAGQFLVVGVRDTGPGMTADQLRRIFTPFTQAEASTTRKFGGTGLGLVIARQLGRLMGGDIEVLESLPGKGTCFQLILPVKIYPHTAFFSDLDNSVLESLETTEKKIPGFTSDKVEISTVVH